MNDQSSLWDESENYSDLDVQIFNNFYNSEDAKIFFETFHQQAEWNQEILPMFGGTPVPRLTAWYGEPGKSYNYSGIHNDPIHWSNLPKLERMRDTLNKLCSSNFNSVLLNLYRDGNDSVDWHSDNEPELGPEPVIASVSLGAKRKFEFRSKYDSSLKKTFELFSGDVIIMSNETQQHWEHRIPKTAESLREKTQPRINLTFRTIYSADDPLFDIA